MCKYCNMEIDEFTWVDEDYITKNLIAVHYNYRGEVVFWGIFNLCKNQKTGNHFLTVGGDDTADIPISFCPFCGRKLND